MGSRGDEVVAKIDAILDVLTNKLPALIGKTEYAVSSSESTNSNDFIFLKPIQEKIQKLRGINYKDKIVTPQEVFKRLGIKSVETAVRDNREFWDELNLNMVDALMEQEGFVKSDNKYLVGPSEST